LQNGGGFGFAANREIGAAGAFGRLFTLKTKHNIFGFCSPRVRRLMTQIISLAPVPL
jgi:hypothetical protein